MRLLNLTSCKVVLADQSLTRLESVNVSLAVELSLVRLVAVVPTLVSGEDLLEA